MGKENLMGRDGERHKMVVHYVLKAQEGRMGLNHLWKAVAKTEEMRNKIKEKQLDQRYKS